MPDMEGSVKPQQISEMFQKFALSFKSKAFEFFSDEFEKVSLLDSLEKFIAEQKFAAVKPASMLPVLAHVARNGKRISNAQFNQTLIASLFATISSFEASYLQLQTAYVPSFDEVAVKNADKALGEPSFHLFGFMMCIGATAARALKSVVQEACVIDMVYIPMKITLLVSTALMMTLNPGSVRTISEVLHAASVASATAIPISAFLRARALFTPSPFLSFSDLTPSRSQQKSNDVTIP
ncbi:hypothetical protein Cgig2_031360 [Carnegiea gigantea]|uniref:DUF641 domain-containing protein n=1 Tax=Carnegiea gigantea TaxID=171969 RepID=A0A9Q1JQD2_9CARY|nr:hypothetical protein Cgig2_031360 [Carnegiea gigantea]